VEFDLINLVLYIGIRLFYKVVRTLPDRQFVVTSNLPQWRHQGGPAGQMIKLGVCLVMRVTNTALRFCNS
jgi:hypothetical protein